MNRAYWPQLSLGAQATWQSDVTKFDVELPGVTVAVPPKARYGATLNLQQNIWDGGVVADQKRVAERTSRVEHEKVNLEWYQVRDRMLQLYFAGVVQQERREQAEDLHRYLGQTLENAQLALSKGVVTQRDVLLVQAQKLEARQAVADAKAQLVSVRRSLEDLSGASIPPQARLAKPAMACSSAGETRPEAAAVHRPELSVLAAQAELLNAQERLDRAAERLKVNAFGTAGYGRPGINVLSDSAASYFIGGVQLTVPLTYLYAGTRRNARAQLAIQRSLIARQQDALMAQIHVQLDSQHAELDRLDGAIAIDTELLRVRARTRRQTELQLSLGTATMTELIGDLSQEDQTRSRGVIHRAQRSFACYQLAFIKGDL